MIPNLCKFLHFNETCPVCGEPLSLYMQLSDSTLWRTLPTLLSGPNEYRFEQFKLIDKDLSSEEDYISLIDGGDTFGLKSGSSKVYQKAKLWNLFFFAMCNEDAIEDKSNGDYIINPYTACYFRSSSMMEMKKNNNKEWRLEEINVERPDMFIRDEIFIFKVSQEDVEKVYILNINYEDQNTSFQYYSTTEEQRKLENFDPKTFKKELPLLPARPNFEMDQRDKLINRFDSWILLS